MPTPKELGVQVGDTIRIAGPRTGPQGKPLRVEEVGKMTLHTSCGVTVSLNSPGWELVSRQPRGPEAIPHEPIPRLEDWAEIEGGGGEVRIHGKVFGSAKFPDGTSVTTSRLKYASRGLVKEGVTVETQNTTYLLGKHGGHIPRAPEAPAVVSSPKVALEWNDHDAGPDKVILDVLGKTFLHVKTGVLYKVDMSAWDSGRDRWMVQYIRATSAAASRPVLYVHLPEDFLRPGRFIEVKG